MAKTSQNYNNTRIKLGRKTANPITGIWKHEKQTATNDADH